jgi:hypothetical protein
MEYGIPLTTRGEAQLLPCGDISPVDQKLFAKAWFERGMSVENREWLTGFAREHEKVVGKWIKRLDINAERRGAGTDSGYFRCRNGTWSCRSEGWVYG